MYKNKVILFFDNIGSKISKNDNIRNAAIGIVLLIIYSVLTKDYTIYLISNNIITVAMIVVFIYVNIIRTKFVDKTFMKGFKLTYLMLIIIIILNIVALKYLFEYTPSIYFIFLFSVQATLECCEIDQFFQFKKSNLKSIVICISYLLLFTMLFYVFEVKDSNYRLPFLTVSVEVSVVISIGTFISTLWNIITNRTTFFIDEFRKVIFYMASILIYCVGLLCLIMRYKEFAEITIFIKGITFYKFYNYIISKVLDNSLIRINDNIEIATKTKRELNSILKKRNTVLNEANIMLQKSQDKNNELIDSIYGGVFLFIRINSNILIRKRWGTWV